MNITRVLTILTRHDIGTLPASWWTGFWKELAILCQPWARIGLIGAQMQFVTYHCFVGPDQDRSGLGVTLNLPIAHEWKSHICTTFKVLPSSPPGYQNSTFLRHHYHCPSGLLTSSPFLLVDMLPQRVPLVQPTICNSILSKQFCKDPILLLWC